MNKAEHCPTCGQAVLAISGDEGTNHYEGLDRKRAEALAAALEECIDLAEEGWGYASDYFREKWECEKGIAKARAALSRYRDERLQVEEGA